MVWLSNHKTKAILICGVAFVFALGAYIYSTYFQTPSSSPTALSSISSTTQVKVTNLHENEVQINGETFKTDAVYTAASREQGLSGRRSLASSESMLFVFPTSGIYGFWMKDMNFSLDMIWADENGQIVYLVEYATPESYPKAFVPNLSARLVLEVNDGTIAAKKIKIGDQIYFNKNILKKATN